ncbi:MAG: hypothetical protein MZV70_67800 [Desulfobacterales bacterium]|nr:hypothetical protein [Desulfobacterales bacterium]
MAVTHAQAVVQALDQALEIGGQVGQLAGQQLGVQHAELDVSARRPRWCCARCPRISKEATLPRKAPSPTRSSLSGPLGVVLMISAAPSRITQIQLPWAPSWTISSPS